MTASIVDRYLSWMSPNFLVPELPPNFATVSRQAHDRRISTTRTCCGTRGTAS